VFWFNKVSLISLSNYYNLATDPSLLLIPTFAVVQNKPLLCRTNLRPLLHRMATTAQTVGSIGPPVVLLLYAHAVSIYPSVQAANVVYSRLASTNHHIFARYLVIYTYLLIIYFHHHNNNNNNNCNNNNNHHLTELTTGSLLLLQACIRRRNKAPHVTTVVHGVVAEIKLPTDEGDTNFDTFITHNAERISDIIDEYQESHE